MSSNRLGRLSGFSNATEVTSGVRHLRTGNLLTRIARTASLLVVSALFMVGMHGIEPAHAAEPISTWDTVRYHLFGTAELHQDTDGQVVRLEVPDKALDAAIVPVVIQGRIAQGAERHIDRIWLIIDGNPSPLAAEFRLTPRSGRADIETRVRIDKPGEVRVITRLNDGSLHHVSHYVKASGGCSVPMNKDPDPNDPEYGDIHLRLRGTPVQGQPLLAQLMIKHPNSSGFAVHPITRIPQTAHFVRQIRVDYAGSPILEAEVDFSISENPNFRFWFTPDGDGEFKAVVIDSDDRRYSESMMIQPRTVN